MRTLLVVLTALTMAALLIVVPRSGWPDPSEPIGPQLPLVFSDRFDGERLDRLMWSDRRGIQPHAYGSPFDPVEEDTFFVPEQVWVADGLLHLGTESRRVQDPLGGAHYTHVSGLVHTGAHFSFTYGYVEARILVPDDARYWPAFWMLPTPVDEEWPPEIDIAEFPPGVGTAVRPTFNVHWRSADREHRQMGAMAYGDTGTSYGGSWHTYGLSWEPGTLTVFLDGRPGPTFDGPAVPSQPMYIVLGMGVVRGTRPEPSAMLVDYVQVWSDAPSAG